MLAAGIESRDGILAVGKELGFAQDIVKLVTIIGGQMRIMDEHLVLVMP